LGNQIVTTAFKADWRLIPKDEEEQFKSTVKATKENLPPKRVVPAVVPFPPLLRRMLLEEARKMNRPLEEPMLPLTIKRGPFNVPVQEGVEAPLGDAASPENSVNTLLPQSMAGHLILSNRNVKKQN
jgi:Mitochondrial 28S ribosomal protein S34